MRVVLDANIFVSAAIRTDPSHQIVEAWLERDPFHLVICPTLLAEVRDVLIDRPRMRRWIDAETAETFLATIEIAADLVPDPDDVSPETRDADDDYLIALARDHQVDYIVTGDRDLLEWSAQRPPVLSPAQFLALVE